MKILVSKKSLFVCTWLEQKYSNSHFHYHIFKNNSHLKRYLIVNFLSFYSHDTVFFLRITIIMKLSIKFSLPFPTSCHSPLNKYIAHWFSWNEEYFLQIFGTSVFNWSIKVHNKQFRSLIWGSLNYIKLKLRILKINSLSNEISRKSRELRGLCSFLLVIS